MVLPVLGRDDGINNNEGSVMDLKQCGEELIIGQVVQLEPGKGDQSRRGQ